MKVFATLATLLGASTATPLFQNQLHGSNNLRQNQHSMQRVMNPSMGMSIGNHVSQHDNIDRRMDMNRQMSTMRDMYRDNQDMSSNRMSQELNQNMMDRNMIGQDMRSNMKDLHRQNQAFGPNQYFAKDDFGNYAYSYNDQQSEKSEERNAQSIKGQYAYIMSNGVKRQVEYVADDNGFHIIRDNADPARIKRSVEPDFIQTRMTSMIHSSPLRNNARDMYSMSNMMGRDMSSNTDRNLMGMEQHRYSNMLGHDSLNQNRIGQDNMGHNLLAQDNMGRNMVAQDNMGRNMMAQDNIGHNMLSEDTMGRNMMGRNIYNIMSNRGLTSDVSNMMGQEMHSNMMGRDMTMNAMSRDTMGQDKNSQMMDLNMLGHRDMPSNMRYSNMMNSREKSSNSLSKNGLMGQRMMQKMEIEHVPEIYSSTRFF